MTETADHARPAPPAKRRPRPKPRRRPQSRNPSAPMTDTEAETDAGQAAPRRTGTAKRPKTASSGSSQRRAASQASSSASRPAPAKGDGGKAGAGAASEERADEGTEVAGAEDERTAAEAAREPSPESPPAEGPDDPRADSSKAAENPKDAAPSRGEEPDPPSARKPGHDTGHAPPARAAKATGDTPGAAAARVSGPRAGAPRLARVARAVAGAGHRTGAARRRALPPWWPAVLCVLVGVLAGLAYGLLRPAQFTATSYVAVVPGDDGDPMTALGFAQAYGRIATDTAVLARAQEESGVPVATLRGRVDAVTSPDAPMIEIAGRARRAGEAAAVANAVARSLTEVAEDSAAATGVELTAFSRARAPREPSTSSPVLTTAVGGSAGVLVGALVLLVRPRQEGRPGGTTPGRAPAGEPPAGRERRPHEPLRTKEAV